MSWDMQMHAKAGTTPERIRANRQGIWVQRHTWHLIYLCSVVSEIWELPDQLPIGLEVHSIHLQHTSTNQTIFGSGLGARYDSSDILP